jgi:hypothetical protein
MQTSSGVRGFVQKNGILVSYDYRNMDRKHGSLASRRWG